MDTRVTVTNGVATLTTMAGSLEEAEHFLFAATRMLYPVPATCGGPESLESVPTVPTLATPAPVQVPEAAPAPSPEPVPAIALVPPAPPVVAGPVLVPETPGLTPEVLPPLPAPAPVPSVNYAEVRAKCVNLIVTSGDAKVAAMKAILADMGVRRLSELNDLELPLFLQRMEAL